MANTPDAASPPPPRFLLVDPEYLIALDMEGVLRAAIDCEVAISNAANLEKDLASLRPHVVVIDTGPDPAVLAKLTETIALSGAATVYSSSFEEFRDGVPGQAEIPVVEKPFTADSLLDAIASVAPPAVAAQLKKARDVTAAEDSSGP